jgi:hypothetical protein
VSSQAGSCLQEENSLNLNTKDRWIVMTFATVGAIVCLGFVVLFFMTIINNHLPWEHAPTAPAHYLAVGKSYSQGFTIGFFLAFSLALVAISFAAWADDRKKARGGDFTPASGKAPQSRLVLGMSGPSRDAV